MLGEAVYKAKAVREMGVRAWRVVRTRRSHYKNAAQSIELSGGVVCGGIDTHSPATYRAQRRALPYSMATATAACVGGEGAGRARTVHQEERERVRAVSLRACMRASATALL